MNFISEALADTNLTTSAQQQPSTLGMLLPFGLMFVVFYFLLIRPQQKKMKDHEAMVNNVQRGEEVITQAGIFGKVIEITDKIITLEIANNVRIRILKSQIASIVRNEQKA